MKLLKELSQLTKKSKLRNKNSKLIFNTKKTGTIIPVFFVLKLLNNYLKLLNLTNLLSEAAMSDRR